MIQNAGFLALYFAMVIIGMLLIDLMVRSIRSHVLKIQNRVHVVCVHEPITGIDVHERKFVKDMQYNVRE